MAAGEFRQNWRILVSAALATGLGLPPVPFYSIGIFAPIFADEFGWSFAAIFGGLAITTGMLFVAAPIVGHLIDRFGSRRIASISLVLLGLSYMTLAFSNGSIVQYYASWIAIALTGVGATPIAFTRAVNGVFNVRRGLALGVTLAGVGVFAVLVKPYANWLIEAAGWRVAIVGIGVLPILIAAPLVFFNFPKEVAGAGAGARRAEAKQGGGLSVREALGKRHFWIMIAASAPMALASGAPVANLENILHSLNMTPAQIVTLTSLIGAMILLGRLLGGWLMDRIWAPLLGLIVLIAAAIGCWLLTYPVIGYEQALVAVALLGLSAGVEVDLLSYLVVRYFGIKSYGALYGALFGLFAVCAGAGPSLLGYFYDLNGRYSEALMLCMVLFVFAGCALLGLGRYPDGKGALRPASAHA